jgi:hypothetical protein
LVATPYSSFGVRPLLLAVLENHDEKVSPGNGRGRPGHKGMGRLAFIEDVQDMSPLSQVVLRSMPTSGGGEFR